MYSDLSPAVIYIQECVGHLPVCVSRLTASQLKHYLVQCLFPSAHPGSSSHTHLLFHLLSHAPYIRLRHLQTVRLLCICSDPLHEKLIEHKLRGIYNRQALNFQKKIKIKPRCSHVQPSEAWKWLQFKECGSVEMTHWLQSVFLWTNKLVTGVGMFHLLFFSFLFFLPLLLWFTHCTD